VIDLIDVISKNDAKKRGVDYKLVKDGTTFDVS